MKVRGFLKGIILLLRPGAWLHFLSGTLLAGGNMIRLSRWAARHSRKGILNDFYSPFRDYSKRYQLYAYVAGQENLKSSVLHYYEFGVAKGLSFAWWIKTNSHPASRFYGFDTFTGLPEPWGTYNAGDMAHPFPDLNDTRHEFVKGLFQESLPGFLAAGKMVKSKKVIHLDADLFSSTLFVLTLIHPCLVKGDILIFDEFNVPNHEFAAFQSFADSYYLKYDLIGAVNNYFQVAIKLR